MSISTVSRFFNKPESLSPQIAAKIEKVVAQTNYRPRIVRPGPKAASRVGIRTGVIALVSLCDFSLEQLWRLPVLPILIGSVQSTLLRRQLSLFLGNLDKDGRLPECVSSRRCDGVIFFSKPPTPEAAAGFRKSLPDLPTVWCFRDHADEEHRFDHIFYDNSAIRRKGPGKTPPGVSPSERRPLERRPRRRAQVLRDGTRVRQHPRHAFAGRA